MPLTGLDFAGLFTKKSYEVDTLALKWDLDTHKFERRLIRYVKKWRNSVMEWGSVESHPERFISEVINADLRIINKWLQRTLERNRYLKVNHPDLEYNPSDIYALADDRPWRVEGRYLFRVYGIKRDKHIDKAYPNKETTLMLPPGQMVLDLAILNEEPKAFWTSEDIPR